MMPPPFFLKNVEKKEAKNTVHNMAQKTNAQTHQASFVPQSLAEIAQPKSACGSLRT